MLQAPEDRPAGHDAPAPGPDLCSEAEITQLVHAFYALARRDPLLGPIFEQHVGDWPAHLANLVDFWSAMLRGTRRFHGAPVQRHNALPELGVMAFERWLALFTQTTATLGNARMQRVADDTARHLAVTLFERYEDALRARRKAADAQLGIPRDGG